MKFKHNNKNIKKMNKKKMVLEHNYKIKKKIFAKRLIQGLVNNINNKILTIKKFRIMI
jgi:hypothetical protein